MFSKMLFAWSVLPAFRKLSVLCNAEFTCYKNMWMAKWLLAVLLNKRLWVWLTLNCLAACFNALLQTELTGTHIMFLINHHVYNCHTCNNQHRIPFPKMHGQSIKSLSQIQKTSWLRFTRLYRLFPSQDFMTFLWKNSVSSLFSKLQTRMTLHWG